MTTIVRLTRAELRKLATTRTFLITLVISVGLAVISVAADASVAGKNGTAALGTTASTDQMLKLGSAACVAMLVLGIIASGGEYRYKTIIPAMLIAPRRGSLMIAKAVAIAVAGVVLSGQRRPADRPRPIPDRRRKVCRAGPSLRRHHA
jgi:hypothetical protein